MVNLLSKKMCINDNLNLRTLIDIRGEVLEDCFQNKLHLL